MKQSAVARPGSTGHPMEDLVQVRMNRLVEIFLHLARKAIFVHGLRSTDLRIMNILYDEREVSINELARKTHVDKAWISRSVVQLLEKRWINKRQDAHDSRVQLVSLTAKSRRLLDHIRPEVLAHERVLLEGINEVAFKKSMDRLMQNAERLLEISRQTTRKSGRNSKKAAAGTRRTRSSKTQAERKPEQP